MADQTKEKIETPKAPKKKAAPKTAKVSGQLGEKKLKLVINNQEYELELVSYINGQHTYRVEGKPTIVLHIKK